MFCIEGGGPTWEYVLWEYDPDGYHDFVLENAPGDDECVTARSIGRFVDGSNGKAEFFLMAVDYVPAAAEFYD